MAVNDTYIYDLPSNQTNVAELLFSIPNGYTNGLLVNIQVVGFFSIFMIGAISSGQNMRESSLYASFGTFMITFLLTLISSTTNLSIAGGNQLIPAAVILMGAILWNYMGGGRR